MKGKKMKLGKDTGSIVNWMMGGGKGPKPEIGMGVTFLLWTDRNPGTIVDIQPKGIIVVQADDAKRIDNNGFSEMQEYEYSPNPTAMRQYFRLNRHGQWEGIRWNSETKRWNKNGARLFVGKREKYWDPCF